MALLAEEESDRVAGLRIWLGTTNFSWSLVVKKYNIILLKSKMMEGGVQKEVQ